MAEPKPYVIGSDLVIRPETDFEFDGDARGVIWCWEAPLPRESYVVGVDPSVGIAGWNRHVRRDQDEQIDNGAIEVIRCGKLKTEKGLDGRDEVVRLPDVQVAEYAGPLDAEELADIANALGRLYCGADEQGMALMMIEMYPGPGLLTYRRLINDFGYTNHFVWKYLDAAVPTEANRFGFWATRESVKYLWIRSLRLCQKGGFIARSPWLVEEMRDCEIDPVKQWGKAIFGAHDDRVRATMIAQWAAHDWSMQVQTEQPRVEEGLKPASWQASDLTYDQMMERWEERVTEIAED